MAASHKLITTPGLAFWLRWSPDGKNLRFTLLDPKRQTTELWEVRPRATIFIRLCPAGASRPRSAAEAGPPTARILFPVRHNGQSAHFEIWALRERPCC